MRVFLADIFNFLLYSFAMDEIDIRIVRHLVADGRISMNDLGEAVGLSATPTARRVRALEADGVITGYNARVDLSLIHI